MARIRTIKPEFPQSESMGRVSRDARLLFIELWTICDDAGRARAASRMLASLLFPYDDDAPSLIEGWLGELEREGCIVRYEVDGNTYLQIAKWLDHQKIDKPSGSKIPPFDDVSRKFAKPRERSSEDLRTKDLDQGTPSLRSGVAPAEPAPLPKQKAARGSRLPEDWRPTQADVEFAKGEGIPPPEIGREAEKFRDYWHARAGPGGVKLDWAATWRSWIRKGVEDRYGSKRRQDGGEQGPRRGFEALVAAAGDLIAGEQRGPEVPEWEAGILLDLEAAPGSER